MTYLEALKSLTEYRNDTQFEKILTDRGLTASGTYSSTDQQAIDLSLADVYLYLANYPKVEEGELAIEYNPKTLIAMRKALYEKHGLKMPELDNRTTLGLSATANPISVGGDDYPAW